MMYQSTPIFVKSQSNFVVPLKNSKNFTKNQSNYCSSPENSFLLEYCLESNLHGLRHIGEKNRHICERLFWIAAFSVSLVAAGLLISDIWKEYKEMPIVTVFTAREVSIDEIPFPSVTICNTNNVQKSVFDYYLRKLTNILDGPAFDYSRDPETLKLFAMISDMYHICDTTVTFVNHFVESTFMDRTERIRTALIKYHTTYAKYLDREATLAKVSQPCEELILKCLWEGNEVTCMDFFDEVITDYGYCCTFNTVAPSLLKNITQNNTNAEKNPENHWELWREANLTASNLIVTKARELPRTQKYPGRPGGLSFLLNSDLDEYFCSNTDSEGFVMGTKLPIDYPKLKDRGLAVTTGREVFVGIVPEITMTEGAVHTFALDDRQCYYGNEYPLQFYTTYTASNCISECIARLTMERCKCVRYYMPHDKDHNAICMGPQYRCPFAVKKNITRTGLKKACSECLPTCTDIKYLKEVSALKLQKHRVRDIFTSENEIKYKNKTDQMSIVHVYFNVDSVHPRIRKQVTSTVKLLSSGGGLLGLCMGFSVLSLLELVYFFTIRFYFAFFEKRRKQMATNLVLDFTKWGSKGM